MKRLRDMGGEPLLERASVLLRAVEPRPESPERMARVRQAIAAQSRPPRRRRVGPAAWVGAGIFVAAAAAAASARFRATSDPPAAVVPGTSSPSGRGNSAHAAASIATPAARPTAKLAPRVSGGVVRSPNRAVPRPSPRGSNDPPSAGSDASGRAAAAVLVHSAVVALNRERNPDKAARLLESYAERDPNGPLAEEALALRIEAATARRDPVARTWAREYLTRYPGGRYRKVAKQALAAAQ